MEKRDALVMGVAIVRDGRVLAARRTRPADARGRWELPGGKVEPGESPSDAVVREIHEELGCAISVTGRLEGVAELRPGLVLRVATAELVGGEPIPHEHDLVRWLGPDQLDEVAWLDADRTFLDELRAHLGGGGEQDPLPLRALFYVESDATSVARRLTVDGFHAELARDRLAGEDDDEDHPWAVLTDAPAIVVEVLVDAYDGWLEEPEVVQPVDVPPLPLPDAPRRVKGHFRTP